MLPTLHAIAFTEIDLATPRRKIRGRYRALGAELTVVPEDHKRTDQPLDGGILGPVPRSPFRRIPRELETDPEVIKWAIPPGSVRGAHGDQVIARLRFILSELRMKADGQRNHLAAMTCLVAHANYETMTTRPGWEAIEKATGCTPRSVARYIEHFIQWGLLGRVAGGRSAECSPPDKNGERHAEAAVYVLCVPHDLGLAPAPEEEAGDINVTPPAVGGTHLYVKNLTPTQARERTSEDAAPPRQINIAAASCEDGPVTPYRPELCWPSHVTPTRQIQRLAAATEIWHRTPGFRRMSHKDLASSLREAFLAGWTVADIEHALAWTPDGTRWPDSGIPDVVQSFNHHACERLRGWIRSRLDGWRTSQGELLRSPDQRAEAAHQEATARQAIERRRTLEEQTQRAAQIAAGTPMPLPWRLRLAEQIEQAAQDRQKQFPT
ncbi:hypothetical protein [Arthrobacter sp. H20]|uniref:hypothetical protein n=1 Tax=Arthrobacter sp. H20 TaxID=1267981 RepID=UPI000478E026|nr:hypothetical protein [Arthrobacter sp. H20]